MNKEDNTALANDSYSKFTLTSRQISPGNLKLEDDFKKLQQAVYGKLPRLNEIRTTQASDTLLEYASRATKTFIPPRTRQEEFLSVFFDNTQRILGTEVATKATEQLRRKYFVSTADHHGPISNCFNITSNLLNAAVADDAGEVDAFSIVLSCSTVSMHNSSFPRGLSQNVFEDTKSIKYFSLLPRSCVGYMVYGFRPYTQQDLNRLKEQIKDSRILKLIDEVYGSEKALSLPNYTDQVTYTNYHLWRKYFESLGKIPADLLYIEQEKVATDLLLKHHMDQDTVVNKILFDVSENSLADRFLQGITGGYSIAEKWGTYLFWAVSKDSKYRTQLWRKGNRLVSEDGVFDIELTPSVIAEKLKAKELVPSTLVELVLLSFYYGLKCMGGFKQINYLTEMKQKYIKILEQLGSEEEMVIANAVVTGDMGGDYLAAFTELPNGETVPSLGLDLLQYDNAKFWDNFKYTIKNITMADCLDALLPEDYIVLYGEKNKDDTLANITAEDITHLLKLDTKIKPIITM